MGKKGREKSLRKGEKKEMERKGSDGIQDGVKKEDEGLEKTSLLQSPAKRRAETNILEPSTVPRCSEMLHLPWL